MYIPSRFLWQVAQERTLLERKDMLNKIARINATSSLLPSPIGVITWNWDCWEVCLPGIYVMDVTVHRLRDGEAVLLTRPPLLHMLKQLWVRVGITKRASVLLLHRNRSRILKATYSPTTTASPTPNLWSVHWAHYNESSFLFLWSLIFAEKYNS
jgi:hypothetical protein